MCVAVWNLAPLPIGDNIEGFASGFRPHDFFLNPPIQKLSRISVNEGFCDVAQVRLSYPEGCNGGLDIVHSREVSGMIGQESALSTHLFVLLVSFHFREEKKGYRMV